ncbi:MAG: hypothetical protein FWF43_07405 [Propionibacteriaceae bacterium]|nr:hypothetical protein [Propionibacteriaceae bacterium]
MNEYIAMSGTTFTDDDIERWAEDAESGQGYSGKHLGATIVGRPVSVGEKARPFTLRLDIARRAKLEKAAAERNTTPSQLVRDLIDAF